MRSAALIAALSLLPLATRVYANSRAEAAAHAKAARVALTAGDTKLAAKELAKAKRVFKQRAKVQEALDALDAQLAGCTTDADCEAKFGKEP